MVSLSLLSAGSGGASFRDARGSERQKETMVVKSAVYISVTDGCETVPKFTDTPC